MAGFLNDKNLRITLVNKETWDYYDLYFRIYNTPLGKKYVKEFEKLRYGTKEFNEKGVKFAPSETYANLDDFNFGDKLNVIIDRINSFYDRTIRKVETVDEEILNYLHHEYEEYGRRLQEMLGKKWWDNAFRLLDDNDPQAQRWPGKIFNENFHTDFMQLNDAIHNAEAFIHAGPQETKLSGLNLHISFHPRVDYEFTEEDATAFVPHTKFGDLFLGYNTLGKNLAHVVHTMDKRSAVANDFVRQTTWSTEILAILQPSNDDPWERLDRFRKFKELGLESHGYKWRDPENREGYAAIGTMYSKQMDDLYSFEHGLKKDFSKFDSIQNVTLVDDIQMFSAYKSEAFRVPHFKKPLPILADPIVKVENKNTAIITWILNDICNYQCRYCPDVLHNGKNVKYDWDVVEPFIDKLFDFYGKEQKRQLLFSFSGGEPTLSPYFPQMLQKIYENGGGIGLTTNLSRTARYIRDNFKYLSYANCTFHPAFEFKNNTHFDWLERAKIASELTFTTVRMMLDPLYWNECIKFIEYIRDNTKLRLEIVFIDDQYGTSDKKITDIDYTEEQVAFFKNWKTIDNRITTEEIQKNNPLWRKYDPDAVATDSSGKVFPITTVQEYINRGQTNWYDYKCAIGKESMFIHQNGHIKRGNCDVGGTIGFVNNWQAIDWFSLNRQVTCTSLRCSCGADVGISKIRWQ